MAIPSLCPLCSANSESQSVVTAHVAGQTKKKRSAFFYCERCKVRYQHPGLTLEEEANFYSSEFEGFMSQRAGTQGGWLNAEDHIASNETTFKRRFEYLRPYLGKNIDILEIGCSSGFMLFPLKCLGHKCVGIEPSGYFSEFVRQHNIEVYDSLQHLSEKNGDSKYDLVMHFFVMEHIADPLRFLKTQVDLLKPGGKIIFEIPNASDPLYSLYDIPAFERFYWSKAHPWYFNEHSLRYLIDQLGIDYKVVLDQRYDISNHIIWARDGKPGGMKRFSDVFSAEFNEAYKSALIKSGHCDTLICIIEKTAGI